MSVTTAAHAVGPEAEAVKEAVAAIEVALFLDAQRKEITQGKQYDRQLNDLVLTAERQFLWDALQRIRKHERPSRPVLLSPHQAKHVERLDGLRGSVCTGDDFAALVLADLKRELGQRARLPQPSHLRRGHLER